MRDKEQDSPISAMVAQRGIKTSADFADFMAALMADVVEGTIDPESARAACLAGDKLLQVAKMQLDFEYAHGDRGKVLRLTGTTLPKLEPQE